MAAQPLPSPSTDPRTDRGSDRTWGTSPPAPGATPSPAAGARRADRQGRVVQSIAHKVTRPCSRNGCPAPARTSMALDYAGKQVTLVPLLDERDPRFLEVCPTHAEGMDVPRGWDLVDERGEEAPAPAGPPSAEEMGSSSTVAVLAAALRGVPSEDDVAPADDAATEAHGLDEPTADVAQVADAPEVAPEVGPDVPMIPERVPPPPPPPVVADVPARIFDLPVNDFDADLVEPGPPVVTPRTPSGRTAAPGRPPSPSADERQLLLSSDDEPTATRGGPRPVPAARRSPDQPPRQA